MPDQSGTTHRKLMWLGPLAVLTFAGAGAGVAAAAEPTTAEPHPPTPACKDAGVKVGFVSGSNEIDQNGKGALAGVATWLQNGDQRSVRLEGYSDKKGGATANQRLSERRAQAAKDFLLSRGIEPDRIMVFGDGEGDDVALSGAEARVVIVTACDIPEGGRRRDAGGRSRADARGRAGRARSPHRSPAPAPVAESAAGARAGTIAATPPPAVKPDRPALRRWASRPRSAAARSASSTKPLAASPARAAPGMRG